MKIAGMFLLVVAVSGFAFGQVPAPEINAGNASSALAFLSGAILVIRSRKK